MASKNTRENLADDDLVWNLDNLEESLVSRFASEDASSKDIDPELEQILFERSISLLEAPIKSMVDGRKKRKKRRKRSEANEQEKANNNQDDDATYQEIGLSNSKMVQCGSGRRLENRWMIPADNTNAKTIPDEDVRPGDEKNLRTSNGYSSHVDNSSSTSNATLSNNNSSEKPKDTGTSQAVIVDGGTKASRRKLRSKSGENERRSRKTRSRKQSGSPKIPPRIACHCKHEFPKKKEFRDKCILTDIYGETEKKGWIEEKINIDTLEELKKAFASADVNRTGSLDLEEFKRLLKEQMNLGPNKDAQIDSLFMKIDWSSEGAITWDEFCTYMQLEYAEKEDSYLRAKEVSFHLPAKIENIPHRDPILRINDTADGTFIACSQEGTVTFWSPGTELKRTRSVVNQEIMSNRTKAKWITDFCLMPHFNKLIVGTGDREIQFFELSSFDPYCQISGLETVPLKLDYSSTGHDECLILFGDNMGCVNIFVIKSAGECLRTWKKMITPDGFIATTTLDAVVNGSNVNFIRWQVHDDWVGQLKYYHDIGQVISCSNNSNTALVIGSTIGSTHVEQQLKEIKDLSSTQEKTRQKYAYNQAKKRLEADEVVFKVYKGVKVFDFSKAKNIIVTGGMDRIIRLWNPYVCLKPTAMLRGHAAPIFYLFIADEDNRIFSISTDRCIKVWDIQDHTCLLTIRPKSHKIRGDLQAIHYSSISRSLAVATDQMAVLNLRHKSLLNADMVVTHKDPVTCCKYNPEFKQVITCCTGSIIKLWDFETGAPIFEYGDAHGEEAITCMTFDNTRRRLITGGRDGALKIWNYNNGHCLRVLKKKPKKNAEVHNNEICDVTYIEMNKNRLVIAVGWDKRINIYYDTLNDTNIHHTQHPALYWNDDLKNGHKEDVLSVANCLPNLLATGSYDGEVIVWNMVSGHIFCHLNPPPPPGYEDQSLDGDLSIAKLIFLQTRAYKKDAGALVVSGPRAHIHVWNVFQGGTLMAQFPGSKMKSAMVSQLVSNSSNTIVYSSDTIGFIYVWNFADYCLTRPANEPPELLHKWRGHVESVASMDLVEASNILITASGDCTVRLWTTDGHYVGTLGQPELWDLHNPATFQYPMVPYDVLIDPLSLPSHPILLEKQSTHDIIHQGEEEDKSLRSASPQVSFSSKQTYVVDDDMIKAMLQDRPFDRGTGKRLRHEKHKKIQEEKGGPSVWQMLNCYQIAEVPQRKAPTLRVNKDNPFDYYDDEKPTVKFS